MTILVAGGDSFTYGSELASTDNAWPSLIAKDKNWKLVNTSIPGGSNSGISRKVLTTVQSIEVAPVVAVMWTFPNRYEFRYDYWTNSKDTPWRSTTVWDIEDIGNVVKHVEKDSDVVKHHIKDHKFLERSGMKQWLREFYKHVGGTEYWEVYTTLKEIIFLQNYLDNKKISYLFTCCDNMLFETHTYNSDDIYIKSLRDQLNFSNWLFFDDSLGFNQWAKKHNYKYATTHPLEDAHIDASAILTEKIDEMVKKSL